ncbi:lysophospholipid acyltransferase family protein [Lachnospira multipara]|uniref:lysophospholipid acyltransferase family protein n=1 Tax=Lachnospira multipara TaxID=28051 RepID=UPI0004E109D0|nr:lysophospholipid acyltransferase family protein [Lachnospira multipara]
MGLESGKEVVIQNIANSAKEGRFNDKVEIDDAVLSKEERKRILGKFVRHRRSLGYIYCNFIARRIVNLATKMVNKETEIVGLENIKDFKGGAIATSNHFNPVDTTIVRYGLYKAGRKKMFIVSQDTNLLMKGILRFLTNYADTIPISPDKDYMNRHFHRTISRLLTKKKEIVLIYPEQEMWFNYRKPRPPKRGAYFYAAKFNVPILSFFTEMIDIDDGKSDSEFNKVKYVLHVLPAIYPDPNLTERENSVAMMKKDYEQKKKAYELAYGKELNYEFDKSDIAGLK